MVSKIFGSLTDVDFASIFFLLSAILFNLRRHINLPRTIFINLWMLRISFSLFLSFLTNAISHINRPLPLLVTTVLLVIFLIESIRMWWITGFFSTIDMPVFPTFRQCAENFIWPIGKFFDDARDLLIAKGFTEKALLQIGVGNQFVMHSPIFYSKDHHSRLQIIFDSFNVGRPFFNCILTSFTKTGKAIITNNLQTIFASFYPQSWDVKRYGTASLSDLLEIHKNRIRTRDTIKIDDSNSLEAINNEQQQIELENCQTGLCERREGNTHITLTFSGRYHLWCDMLQYAYFGKSF